MRRQRNLWLALALSLIAAFYLLCGTTFAAESADIVYSGSCGENVMWSYDGAGTLTISGTGPMKDYGMTQGFTSNHYHDEGKADFYLHRYDTIPLRVHGDESIKKS